MLLHKAAVHAVAFSPNDKYIASLGGVDDGTMCIWLVYYVVTNTLLSSIMTSLTPLL